MASIFGNTPIANSWVRSPGGRTSTSINTQSSAMGGAWLGKAIAAQARPVVGDSGGPPVPPTLPFIVDYTPPYDLGRVTYTMHDKRFAGYGQIGTVYEGVTYDILAYGDHARPVMGHRQVFHEHVNVRDLTPGGPYENGSAENAATPGISLVLRSTSIRSPARYESINEYPIPPTWDAAKDAMTERQRADWIKMDRYTRPMPCSTSTFPGTDRNSQQHGIFPGIPFNRLPKFHPDEYAGNSVITDHAYSSYTAQVHSTIEPLVTLDQQRPIDTFGTDSTGLLGSLTVSHTCQIIPLQ